MWQNDLGAAHADTEAAAGGGCEAAAGAGSSGCAATARCRRRNASGRARVSGGPDAAPRCARQARRHRKLRSRRTLSAERRGSESPPGARCRSEDALHSALTEAAKGLPFKSGLFEPFIDGCRTRAKSLPPLTPESARRHAVGAQRRRPAAASRRPLDRPRHDGRRAQRAGAAELASTPDAGDAARSQAGVRRSRRAPARAHSLEPGDRGRAARRNRVGRAALREPHGARDRADGADHAADPRDPARLRGSR